MTPQTEPTQLMAMALGRIPSGLFILTVRESGGERTRPYPPEHAQVFRSAAAVELSS